MVVSKRYKHAEDGAFDDGQQLLGSLATLPPDKMAAWQSFWVCPRCGNPRAWKFREADREWIECGQCEYYEEK